MKRDKREGDEREAEGVCLKVEKLEEIEKKKEEEIQY